MTSRSRHQQGMTLLELMIAVAIVGILASVAIPSYLHYQLTARTAEAKANLGGLSRSQLAYYSEYGSYVSVASEPSGTLGIFPNSQKRDSSSVGVEFGVVGWIPEGDVYYDYDTVTDIDAVCTCTGPCFTASAFGDLDANGAPAKFSFAQPDSGGFMCPGVVGLAPARPNEPIQDLFMSRY